MTHYPAVVRAAFLALVGVFCLTAAHAGGTNVLTYHYDTLRTGWDSTETILTPANVASANFGPVGQIALDEQVDAQPLFVSNVPIAGVAHDVVYVATENNTIYAIDGNDGIVLGSRNLGTPVPMTALPDQCTNNSDNVGINSTPVIDASTNTLYAITYTYENGKPVFRIHAIDITTLADKVPSAVISATAPLSNARVTAFNAANNRQRAGLLELNGNIYAGFADWCDLNANVSRGWVLGWSAATLAPLAPARLINQLVKTPSTFFNSSVWMSGYGIASDGISLFFNTGNSDPAGRSYNSVTNLDESVVKLSSDLATVQDFFTPRSGTYGWSNLDKYDDELSGAGVLLLPDQPGATPHLAVTAGKAGYMYLLNRDAMGGLTNASLGAYPNAGCWCGQSYYQGADGLGRVVESTGYNVDVWKVRTSPTLRLVKESTSPTLGGLQDPGFFTTVSSNGTAKNTAVIWAVERPSDASTLYVSLKAFDPSNGSAQIYAAVAGFWPFAPTANANIVPVVANGHVLVASYKTLIAFGLTTGAAKAVTLRMPAAPGARPLPAGVTHELHGTVTAIDGASVSLRLRTGRSVTVDMAAAQAGFHVALPVVGRAADVRGDYAGGVFVARSILKLKDRPALWPSDQ